MPDSDDQRTEDRLVRIETALAHLQHDVEELNQALTRYFGRLKEFDERFTRLELEFESLHEGPEHRDAADEKPPHY